MPNPNDYSTWDLDSLNAEEQEFSRSRITKTRDSQSTPFAIPGKGSA